MCPAGMETGPTGVQPAFGASAQSLSPMGGVSSHPPQPCPPSGMHVVRPSGTNMHSMCVTMQSPATEGDQVGGHKWTRTRSTVSGLSEIPFSPDVGQGGFMTEARGTTHVIGIAPIASPAIGTSMPSDRQPSHGSNASVESASKPPLFKLDKLDGSVSIDTFFGNSTN